MIFSERVACSGLREAFYLLPFMIGKVARHTAVIQEHGFGRFVVDSVNAIFKDIFVFGNAEFFHVYSESFAYRLKQLFADSLVFGGFRSVVIKFNLILHMFVNFCNDLQNNCVFAIFYHGEDVV